MDEIERRILEAAMELAAEGGIEAVRQRDLAARANVALATLYSRFSSKHVILATAIQLEQDALERSLARTPIHGKTPEARVASLFERATERFVQRPKLGHAILSATVSGEAECTAVLVRYHAALTALAADALQGHPDKPAMDRDTAMRSATLLLMIWFSNLVGWNGGAATPEIVIEVMRQAAPLVLYGVVPR